MSSRSRAVVLEVLELLGEELVPLLQRGELLQRQRVHLAQQRSAPARRRAAASPARPARTAPARAAAASESTSSPGAGRRAAARAGRGPYSAISDVGVDPELLDGLRPASCSMRSRCSARATSSRCTESVSRSISAVSSRTRARSGQQLGGARVRARSAASRAAAAAAATPRARHRMGGDRARPRGRPPPSRARRARRSRRTGRAVRSSCGARSSGLGAAGQRPDPLLGGAHGEPGLHLAGRRRPRQPAPARPGVGDGVVLGASLHLGALRAAPPARPGGSVGVLAETACARSARRSRSASAAPTARCEPSWPSCSATAAIRASDSCSRRGPPRPARRRPAALACPVPARTVRARPRWSAAPSCVGSLVDGGLDLEQGRRAEAEPPTGQVGADHVAVAGDRAQVGVLGDERPRGRQVGHDEHVVRAGRARAGAERRRRGDEVERGHGSGRGRTDGGRRRRGRPAESSPARPASSSFSSSTAATAVPARPTATASAAAPRAAATAVS